MVEERTPDLIGGLRELLEMEGLPASCTVGDWLRRKGKDSKGLSGLAKVERHEIAQY